MPAELIPTRGQSLPSEICALSGSFVNCFDSPAIWFRYAFTASEEYYARPILKMLDPEKKIFKGCYFRSDCTQIKGKTFVKDLGKVETPDMARTVLVDNNPMSFLCQPRNGIPILSWYGSAGDTALNILDNFLRRLQPLEDVRPFLNKTFGVEKALAKFQKPVEPASSP